VQRCHDVIPLDLCEGARRRGRSVAAAFLLRQSQCRTCRDHDSTLDDVLKFTNIPGPRMVLQGSNELVRDFLNLLAQSLAEPADEVGDQKRDVLGAFA